MLMLIEITKTQLSALSYNDDDNVYGVDDDDEYDDIDLDDDDDGEYDDADTDDDDLPALTMAWFRKKEAAAPAAASKACHN